MDREVILSVNQGDNMHVETEIIVERAGDRYAVKVWCELTVIEYELDAIIDFGFECKDVVGLKLSEGEKDEAYEVLTEKFNWYEYEHEFEPEYDPDE